MFWGTPPGPVDKDGVEDVGKNVRHDPAQWSAGMLKLIIIVAVVIGGLVVWTLLSG